MRTIRLTETGLLTIHLSFGDGSGRTINLMSNREMLRATGLAVTRALRQGDGMCRPYLGGGLGWVWSRDSEVHRGGKHNLSMT